MIDKFVRLPAVWDRANGKLMHFNAFWSDRAEHCISETAVRIMILNGEDAPLSGSGTVQQRGAINGNNTIKIDDPHGEACAFQCVVGLQGFESVTPAATIVRTSDALWRMTFDPPIWKVSSGPYRTGYSRTTSPNVDHPFMRSSRF